MKQLESSFNKISKFLKTIAGNVELCTLSINDEKDILLAQLQEYTNLKNTSDEAESLFNASLRVIPIYAPYGEALARQEFLLALLQGMGLVPFVVDRGRIAIPLHKDFSTQRTLKLLKQIDELFCARFHCHLERGNADISEMAVLEQRMLEARRYYIEDHGAWTSRFITELGDDLSRDSFLSFLRQRIKVHVFEGNPVCYPVMPPKQSAAWRKERENAHYDFPVLHGCRDDVRDFFYRDTFIYEQYAVPGIVEALPGDVVIDAGAFIGDTACYFSRKIGKNGKVFAFEIVPESIEVARQNMQINGCGNVEVLPNALSDRASNFTVTLNPHSNSAAFVTDAPRKADETVVSVEAVTLDDFVEKRAISVDFIKADIEGAEMQLLRGGTKTITRDAPVCAFSLYHKQEDYWQIPQFLKELRPDYMFWFRCEAEPVLFAKKKA